MKYSVSYWINLFFLSSIFFIKLNYHPSQVAVILLLVGAVYSQDLARQFQSMDDFGNAQFGYSHPGQSSVTHRDAEGGQRGSYAYIDPDGREVRVSYIADQDGFRIVGNDQVAPAPQQAIRAQQPVRSHIAPVSGNFLQDTPEVAAARATHLAALNAALANARASGEDDGSWSAEQDQRWSNPAPVQQQWTAPAPVQQQWTAPAPVQQQRWTNPATVPQQNWNTDISPTWNAPPNWNVVPTHNTAPAQQWNLPQAVQDTPEVAAAKAEFQRAFQQAAALAAANP